MIDRLEAAGTSFNPNNGLNGAKRWNGWNCWNVKKARQFSARFLD